jgi:hypothetical protein
MRASDAAIRNGRTKRSPSTLGGIAFGYSVPLSLEGCIAPGKQLKTAEVS